MAIQNIKPMIIAEEYLEPGDNENDLKDYKFFCFDGKVKYFYIVSNRQIPKNIKFDFLI